MGKQIDIQKRQWEHSCVPVFRIAYIQNFDAKSVSFVIDNPNNIYYQVDNVTFSTDGVIVKEFWQGTVTSTTTRNGNDVEKEEYKGLIVTLSPVNESNHIGTLQIVGKDMLGNKFIMNTNDLIFKNFQLDNHLKISRTYLKKI